MVERCCRARRCGLVSRGLIRAMSRVVNHGTMTVVVNVAKSGDAIAGVDATSSVVVGAGMAIAMRLRRLSFVQNRAAWIRRRLCSQR